MKSTTEKEFLNKGLQNETVKSEDSELKNIIVQYVGNKTNPENDEVTVENIVEVFADQFPEFLVVIAEQNWVNGYSQALSDVEFMKNNPIEISNNSIVSGKHRSFAMIGRLIEGKKYIPFYAKYI